MIRSYWRVAALLCLAAAVGCGDSNGGNGGSGGTGGTGGTGGAGGTGGGTGGTGGGGVDPDPVTKEIGMGCTNNITSDNSTLDWSLTADPGPIVGDASVDVDFDGVATFSESFLDVAVSVTQIKQVVLDALQSTALPRAGLTGAGVALSEEPIPTTCDGGMNAGGACTTDSDCPPVGYFNCVALVDLPISEDCAPGGLCEQLDKIGQCEATAPKYNGVGFCITGPLSLPMAAASGTFTADASGGTVLLGWDDQNTGATTTTAYGCAADGATCDPANDQGDGSNTDCVPVGVENTCDAVDVYVLPVASLAGALPPNGLRVTAGILQVALNCTMAVDSGLEPTRVSPTPDADLISFDIE